MAFGIVRTKFAIKPLSVEANGVHLSVAEGQDVNSGFDLWLPNPQGEAWASVS
jgi:hypothetical protein